MPAYWVVECDHDTCGTRHTAATWAEVKKAAQEEGWKISNQQAPTLCAEHRPDKYSPCVVCGRPRRRRGWKKKDHPGTMAWGTGGRCVSCASAEQLGASADKRLDDAVQQYMVKQPAEFFAVYGSPLPLDHEVRKVVPQDLWQTLGI